jgi:NTE family protein
MNDQQTASRVATRRAPHAHQGLRDPALAVCLSGGGYRAMLFHLGSLRRLNEFGLLGATSRFSSVSGGSITSAVLAARWSSLNWSPEGVATNFDVVEQPIFDLAGKTIDIRCGLASLVPLRSAARALASAYRRLLFGTAGLQDLPDNPRFTFNTTNLTTGTLFRWSKEYGADYQVGSVFNPEVSIADVVAASSAFPPFLSPMNLRVPGTLVHHGTREPVIDPPSRLTLTDGGVYDNLGLQPVESFHTVLASDGGAPLDYNPKLRANWLSQSMRTTLVIDAQVRALRRKHLVRELTRGERLGALWTIATPLDRYPVDGKLPVSIEVARQLAAISTRLASMPVGMRRRLMNWGYVSADAAVRSYVEPSFSAPAGLPFPDAPFAG